jgi:hypothetical protein
LKWGNRIKAVEQAYAEAYPEEHLRGPQERQAEDGPWFARRQEVEARFTELAQAALDLVPEEDFDRVQEGLTLLAQRRRGSGFARGDWGGSPWCWGDGFLERGWSRLPPDLSPTLACRLLVIRLAERDRLADLDVTCTGCGLLLRATSRRRTTRQ